MTAAIWQMLTLPFWYLIAVVMVAAPFAWLKPNLAHLALLGTVSFFVAAYRTKAQPDRRFLLFLLPFALSEAFVGFAALIQAEAALDSDLFYDCLLAFFAIQFVVCVCLTFILKGARVSAFLFSFFSLAYAVFAAFFGMSFSGRWPGIA